MFRGEESLTAPVLEMLLKLIIYASELLAKPSDNWYGFHRTAGMFSVSPLLVAVQDVVSLPSAEIFSQSSQWPDSRLPLQITFCSVPGKNRDILQQ